MSNDKFDKNGVKLTYETPYELLPETNNKRYSIKRLRVCERCNELFVPKSSSSKFCDDCKYEHELEKARERAVQYRITGRRKLLDSTREQRSVNGKGRGCNQSMENNGNWKNGTGVDWFQKALEILPNCCSSCGKSEEDLQRENPIKTRNLLLHHKDGNHYNNEPSNWEILCKGCHQSHHLIRDSKGRFTNKKG